MREYARGGIRTHTPVRTGLLRPLCLPFHHPGDIESRTARAWASRAQLCALLPCPSGGHRSGDTHGSFRSSHQAAAAGTRGASPLLRLQSDEKLVALVRRGHHGAFEALVQRYQPRLLAFCRHMLGSQEDAEDVLQEVFAASYNALLPTTGRSTRARGSTGSRATAA